MGVYLICFYLYKLCTHIGWPIYLEQNVGIGIKRVIQFGNDLFLIFSAQHTLDASKVIDWQFFSLKKKEGYK